MRIKHCVFGTVGISCCRHKCLSVLFEPVHAPVHRTCHHDDILSLAVDLNTMHAAAVHVNQIRGRAARPTSQHSAADTMPSTAVSANAGPSGSRSSSCCCCCLCCWEEPPPLPSLPRGLWRAHAPSGRQDAASPQSQQPPAALTYMIVSWPLWPCACGSTVSSVRRQLIFQAVPHCDSAMCIRSSMEQSRHNYSTRCSALNDRCCTMSSADRV